MLRVDRHSEERGEILQLSGRIQSMHIPELLTQIARSTPGTQLDLDDVTIVDREAVTFLGQCERNGNVLLNCPLYVREWILIETRREHQKLAG
jgi:hypothetical protein